PQTHLVFRPDVAYPTIADRPTIDEVRRSAARLIQVVKDFPFRSVADRSAWLALVLSLVGRSAVRGCVPLFAITANVRGSGKSKLADVAGLIAFGRPAPRKPFPRGDEELRKMVTTIAIEGTPFVLLDNLDCRLGGAALDAALTAETWNDRILGASRTTGELPLRTVWTATGNNLTFGSDVARRVLPIVLDSPHENPEERSDFEQPNLAAWVLEHRTALVVDALTILRGRFVLDAPRLTSTTWGSFEDWERVIRGAIVAAELPDPLATREAAKSADESAALLGLLIAGLEEIDPNSRGVTTRQIGAALAEAPSEGRFPSLAEAVDQICGAKFNPRTFGRTLTSLHGRRLEGRMIVVEAAGGHAKRFRSVSSQGELVSQSEFPPSPGQFRGHLVSPNGTEWESNSLQLPNSLLPSAGKV
ncbi:MAG TPA: hypothetical protein PLI18_17580, partial [Pirellulaceae bacterium]|nr:hypothetical protein [Pirellulaceae bacterium]